VAVVWRMTWGLIRLPCSDGIEVRNFAM